jgi:hypothetical protein
MIKSRKLNTKRKNLNRLSLTIETMKRGGSSKLKGKELDRAIKEAQKDPEFIREINEFIKATTTIHKLY